MALDQYSYCPCGSGKKIKFCKCFDNLQEMIKVDRMIEGDQSIAALDRINLLMKTFPSDAWLHAMKCALLLKLREVESLEEASAKFIRLRPDNPLALLYRSLLAIMRGNVSEAASLYLQSLAETSESFQSLLPTVASNLITLLVRTGQTIPALLHCENLLDALGEATDVPARIYQSIIGMDAVNVLARETIPSLTEPEDAPWKERFREAYVLLRNLRVAQAKTKFEALQREYGAIDEILVALFHCKLLLIDIPGAASIAGKLAQSNSLSQAERVYYQALQFELDPAGCELEKDDEICRYSIADDSTIEEKLIASQYLVAVSDDQLRQMVMSVAEEEVSPKNIYTIAVPIFEGQYDDCKPRQAGGWLAHFGRQTDKAPQILISEPTSGMLAHIPALLRAELGLENRKVIRSASIPYYYQISPQVTLASALPSDQKETFLNQLKQRSIGALLDMSFQSLQGRKISELKDDPTFKTKLQALLLHWEASGSSILTHDDFIALHASLGLEMPSIDASEDTFDLVGGASYYWTDLSTIDAESLIRLMQSAMSRNVATVYDSLVRRAKTMIWTDELRLAADYTTWNMEVRTVTDPNDAEKLLEKIYEHGKQLQLPVGNAVLERYELLAQMGRRNDANMFMQRALREVPNDPILLQYIQALRYQVQQQQSMGTISSDLDNALNKRSAARPAAPAPAPGGLWTPGQSPSSPAPAAESPAPSKLWLPGQ